MRTLLANVVLREGIAHIEDLPVDEFIDTVEKLKDKVVTEKLDGSNLWFGVDDKGFFTSREGKSKRNSRFYSVDDYPVVASYNGFRAAHLALEQVKGTILKILQPGDIVEVEVIFGKQPNTVTYGAEDKNYIVILRGVGADDAKIDALAQKLNDKTVEVTSTIVSSDDGDDLKFDETPTTWHFTQVTPIDHSELANPEVEEKLKELKAYLKKNNETMYTMTNHEMATVKLGSIEKDKRDVVKKERDRVLSVILNDYKIPIKELFLSNFVRKVKPKLQTDKLEPNEDLGIEGVVIRDKTTGNQVKIVDKDVFTAVNTFNNFIRSSISGLVRTDDQDASIELRGGAFGQAKIRIADLLGIKELALSSSAKKVLAKFKGETPEATAIAVANSMNLESFEATKNKISAILTNAVDEVNEILIKFKTESDSYRLKLKTGKEIGLTDEVIKRNLTAFAEAKRDIALINEAVLKSTTTAELVMALYGRTIQSLFIGSDDVKETFSLLKKISEDDAPAADAGSTTADAGTITAAAIAPFEKPLFKGTVQRIKRNRNFVKSKKFEKPKMTEGKSLMKMVEFDMTNQNATDVDDSAAAKNDVEFKQLRNNINVSANVNDSDVNRYLDKAHELNDEVDTVTYGLELDDGSIVKVYVNADEADGFEEALSKMLGEYDDVEEAINALADNFDIVDVEWPKDMASPSTQGEAPGTGDFAPPESPDGAEVVSSRGDTTPQVNPVIDLGDVEENDEIVPTGTTPDDDLKNTPVNKPIADPEDEGTSAETPPDASDQDDGEDATIDTTFYNDDENTGEEEVNNGGEGESPPPNDDEIVGGEVATNDEESEPEEESEEGAKPKKSKKASKEETTNKTEESYVTTFGDKFKQKLLTEKKHSKKEKDDQVDDQDNDDSDHETLPAALQKLLTSFPTRGDKAMIVLLYTLGAPLDALALKKADLRNSIESASDKFMKDSQFRLWVKKLSNEIQAAQVTEAKLEDEIGTTLQRVILEIMQQVGLPDSVERLARAKLRANVKAKAKLAMTSAKIRQYLKIVAEMLGVDATTGMMKEDMAGQRHPKTGLPMFASRTEAKDYFDSKADDKGQVPAKRWEHQIEKLGLKSAGRYPAFVDAHVMESESFNEGKNHLGEKEYMTWASWKAAAKKAAADVWFDGDQDIAQAMIGEKPFAKGKTFAIGEWGGDTGSIFTPDAIKDSQERLAKIAEAAVAGLANPAASFNDVPDDSTGNEWVDEVMKLVTSLGIPGDNLNYRKSQVIQSLRQQRQKLTNYALVLRNVKKLNQVIGNTVREELDEDAKMFKVKWTGYHGKPKPATHGLDFFTDDNGFEPADLKKIKALGVGEDVEFHGVNDKVSVTRVA